eukprot:GHVO01009911.1.p1 GENE.GHVO01009911.1~~GHVO01009911.1.p1  ORF type:complete len:838 (+),score=131.55 GHVO01009911.1:32-2515(+)
MATADPSSITLNAHLKTGNFKAPRIVQDNETTSATDKYVYETGQMQSPPPPFKDVTYVDTGKASPRYIRTTMNCIPTSKTATDAQAIPFGGVFQIFAMPRENEQPVHTVNLTRTSPVVSVSSEGEGPLRCPRCGAYVNPSTSIDIGDKARCNICECTFTIPQFYKELLDVSQIRHDDPSYARYELMNGVVDFTAPVQYSSERDNCPACYVFVIEATYMAQQSGILFSVLHTIRHCISNLPQSDCRVGFLLYDENLHFYIVNEKITSNLYEVLVVSDIDDPFLPVSPYDFFISINNREAINIVLDGMSNSPPDKSNACSSASAGNGALAAAVQIMDEVGSCGSVMMFYTTSPNIGIGSFPREEVHASNILELEAEARKPRKDTNSFYNSLSQKCYKASVSVDTFFIASSSYHLDIRTLGIISTITGGHVHYMPNYVGNRDYEKLFYDLWRRLTLPQGYNCQLRVRCSKGIEIKSVDHAAGFYGYGKQPDRSVSVPRLDADSAMTFICKHDDHLENHSVGHIQVSCVYTTPGGKRLIRCINTTLGVTSKLQISARFSDAFALIHILARQASHDFIEHSQKWREQLKQILVAILVAYRVNVAMDSPYTHLVLPEGMRLLPLLVASLFKHIPFRPTKDVRLDERFASLYHTMHVAISDIDTLLYPRLYGMINGPLNPHGPARAGGYFLLGTPTGSGGEVYLPRSLAASGTVVHIDSVYLLDTGRMFMLYVGKDVSPEMTQQLFGVPAVTSENQFSISLDPDRGDDAKAIVTVVNQFRKKQTAPFKPLRIIPPLSYDESRFRWHLVEDRLGSEPGYNDFVLDLHVTINKALE